MNQNTRWAIKEAFPLRWEADGIGGFGGKLAGPGPDIVYDTWRELQRQKWQDIKLENPHIVQHI